jgi:Domain of unknown function (DUF4082)/Bacterial Ig domain
MSSRFSRRQFVKLAGSGATLNVVTNASAATLTPIVAENALPGTASSEWDLNGAGQFSGFGLHRIGVEHYLEGFAHNISVNRGGTIDFKINTDCRDYRVDIYRLGYYGGSGARRLGTIRKGEASLQPAPLADYSIGFIDAGDWTVSASWPVPANAVSGVYIAHLVRQDSVSGANHIPFIVRDDEGVHDIIFQTSDQTWQAYNGWGGYNLYGGAGKANSSTGRAYRVSYNRPIATRDGIGTNAGPHDFVFGVEVCAIRWLEANGYDVAYISGVDSDRLDPEGRGRQFVNHARIFLSVGHDEYWSGNQRANVEAARAAGVHLAFLSGNEVFWKTRFSSSIDSSSTPYRTLVCYKETIDQEVLDPANPPIWTGSWRDPTFSPPADGGRPENALTGQWFAVDSWRSDVIQIPYAMTQLRFWRNTSVATTKPGQSAMLVKNLLGYEFDESPDNGWRPPGLFHLSSTTLNVNTYLLDHGHVVGTYVATHRLGLYRHPESKALVFGAGTVFWVWGLDSNHDLSDLYPTPVDLNVQQATVNLFADMGVQPASIQKQLVAAEMSADVTPPSSTIDTPDKVLAQKEVTLSGAATDADGIVAGVEVSTDGGLQWHTATGTASWSYRWWPSSAGTYQILSRAVDDSGNLETPRPGLTLTVAPGTMISLFDPAALSPYGQGSAPALVGPINDSNSVELGIEFQTSVPGSVIGLRFYKNPWNVGSHVGNLWKASGELLASATFTIESERGWQQINLATPVELTPGVTYITSFHSESGHYSMDPKYFAVLRPRTVLKAPWSGSGGVFAYGAGKSVFPANRDGATNFWADLVFVTQIEGRLPPVAKDDPGFTVLQDTPLAIFVSTLLANDSDPNGLTLSLLEVSKPTNGHVTYDAGAQIVTFTPKANYIGSASFTYAVTNGYSVSSALVLLTVTGKTFSLFAPDDEPAVKAENDPHPVEVGVKFQVSTAGQATGVRFYKSLQNTGPHTGNLWTAEGLLLSSAIFRDESPGGWQQAFFDDPVPLKPGTKYIVSYHSSKGFYSADTGFFLKALIHGPLMALSSGNGEGNGVYAYGTSSIFPGNSYQASNYWVDVIFAASDLKAAQASVFGSKGDLSRVVNSE